MILDLVSHGARGGGRGVGLVAPQAWIDASHSASRRFCSVAAGSCVCSALACCNWRHTTVVSVCQALIDRSRPPGLGAP